MSKGRTGRVGQKGTFVLIYDQEQSATSQNYETEIKKNLHTNALRETQNDVINCVHHEFLKLYCLIPVRDSLNTSLLNGWKQLLEEMEQSWIGIIANNTSKPEEALIAVACSQWELLIEPIIRTQFQSDDGLQLKPDAIKQQLQQLKPSPDTLTPVLTIEEENVDVTLSSNKAFLDYTLLNNSYTEETRKNSAYQIVYSIFARLVKSEGIFKRPEFKKQLSEMMAKETRSKKIIMMLDIVSQKIYESNNPLEIAALKRSKREMEKIIQWGEIELDTNSLTLKKPILKIQEKVTKYIYNYQNTWWRLYRIWNTRTIRRSLQKEQTLPNLLELTNEAILKLIEKDTKKCLGKNRALTTSRYLETLRQAKTHILLYAQDEKYTDATLEKEVNFFNKLIIYLDPPKLEMLTVHANFYSVLENIKSAQGEKKPTNDQSIILNLIEDSLDNIINLQNPLNLVNEKERYAFLLNKAFKRDFNEKIILAPEDSIYIPENKTDVSPEFNLALTKKVSYFRQEVTDTLTPGQTLHDFKARLKNNDLTIDMSIIDRGKSIKKLSATFSISGSISQDNLKFTEEKAERESVVLVPTSFSNVKISKK